MDAVYVVAFCIIRDEAAEHPRVELARRLLDLILEFIVDTDARRIHACACEGLRGMFPGVPSAPKPLARV